MNPADFPEPASDHSTGSTSRATGPAWTNICNDPSTGCLCAVGVGRRSESDGGLEHVVESSMWAAVLRTTSAFLNIRVADIDKTYKGMVGEGRGVPHRAEGPMDTRSARMSGTPTATLIEVGQATAMLT
jgi:hypothetical protein